MKLFQTSETKAHLSVSRRTERVHFSPNFRNLICFAEAISRYSLLEKREPPWLTPQRVQLYVYIASYTVRIHDCNNCFKSMQSNGPLSSWSTLCASVSVHFFMWRSMDLSVNRRQALAALSSLIFLFACWVVPYTFFNIICWAQRPGVWTSGSVASHTVTLGA